MSYLYQREAGYRFTLKPYKTPGDKETCPACGVRRKYVRYLDTQTAELLPEAYGRCDREDGCGYFLDPYKDGYSKLIHEQERGKKVAWNPTKPPEVKRISKPVSYIPFDLVEKSLSHYYQNHFTQFLLSTFGTEVVQQINDRYLIGTSKVWPGATIFWQIDKVGKVRTGKIMLYSPLTGKRKKQPYDHFTWVHKKLDDSEQYNLSQCLFGEHLLSLYPIKTVALVESEKTAIISSIYFPEYVWVATGGKGFDETRLQALKGRRVILCPDLSEEGKTFINWADKAQKSANLTSYVVSDFLEKKARPEERGQGLDLADELLRINYQTYRKQEARPLPTSNETSDEVANIPLILPEGMHWLTNREGKRFQVQMSKYGYPTSWGTN